jgi:anti-anti-sigma factor
MEIVTRRSEDALELVITGRLDAYWADHLSAALEEALRGGADRIRLNMAAVSYMSSVGIRVLLRFYKQLQAIQGTFAVSSPSEPVKTVLELAGLEALLITAGAATATTSAPGVGRRLERDSAIFEVFEEAAGETLRCTAIGDPAVLARGSFSSQHCRTVTFPENTIGVGVGAFGRAFDDCRGRFGEFLAAGGAAAYLPTDGTNVADYLVARAAFVPSVEVLYALACTGTFAYFARFEAAAGATRAVTLSTAAETALEIAGADAAGVVIVAESAGLVGAALRRSPALEGANGTLFDHPAVREWLSFTPERAYMRSLALIVGIAARSEHPDLAPFLRPLGGAPWRAGHFHAAAFSYRPLQKRDLDLATTVDDVVRGGDRPGRASSPQRRSRHHGDRRERAGARRLLDRADRARRGAGLKGARAT